MTQAVWVLAPALTSSAAVAPERIGDLAALVSLGSIIFFVFGGTLLLRFGSMRMIQAGILVTVASVGLLLFGSWPLMLLGNLMMGLGYGPSPPAGSDILARSVPPRQKALAFSVRQAGGPLGAMIAGATLPAIALAMGWRTALVVSAIVGIVCVMALQPLRAAVDATRQRDLQLSFRSMFGIASLLAPIRSMRLAPSLPSLTAAAVALALVHGSLSTFMVTYMTTEIGLPFTLAGITYSALQLGGMVGRIFVGWIADRVGTVIATLKVLAVTTTAMTLVMAAIQPTWPVALTLAVIVLTGIAATSWNGIHLAEVARLAPEGKVSEAASGSVFFTFLAYSLGPFLFSQAVSVVGSYGPVFAASALLGLVAGVALIFADRKAR